MNILRNIAKKGGNDKLYNNIIISNILMSVKTVIQIVFWSLRQNFSVFDVGKTNNINSAFKKIKRNELRFF